MHYRQIWEKHNGKIPDEYEIHHKDGNHSNDDISNLQLVSIEEHLDIHQQQGDTGAVLAILMRMPYDRNLISEMASKTQRKLLNEGNHNFQKINRVEVSKRTMRERLDRGLGAFLIKDPIENSRKAGLKAKEKKAGFLNTQSEKHGSKFVIGSFWWNNNEGQRKRSSICPGENWKRGML